MSAVTRLVTFVDIDNQADDRISVSARHEAELADGSRVLLLNDRGWSASGPPNIWAATSVEDIQETTRTVVGPDEPFGDRSQEDMEADHWASLQQIAHRQGVITDAAELRQLPHEVVLSPRLLARIGGDATG
jgi:dTDP-glucose pyrophosphorylase